MNSRKLLQGLVFFFISLLGFLLLFHLLVVPAKPILTRADYKKNKIEQFFYVALGDSLTQGVGDATNQGGFVPLVAQSLTNDEGVLVEAQNFGVAGNTSNQILKRMKETSEISDALEKADLMTLTVGGNDLRKVILDNITNLKISTFKKPSKDYSKRLLEIIKLARKKNPDLPIYVLGIYNPFYLNFPEMTDMQIIVDNWNQTTENTIADLHNVYFVPINDLLYQGIDGEKGIIQVIGDETKIINNALYQEDNFHPNNTGYEIMKRAVLEKIRETKDNWKN
ncbi:lysophospholipase L1 [Streptococcus varani]|uniref:Lysophospholipase L1 n=1 Tax=Streptococcus varani TaxID=1608583 RepID=A0A0E3WFC0_9STRE|nr:SGNH/GDSL hydrolase family protein [Streptococcus varani]CQR25241.1 lysophospholipase L1 [Streptococcus varani]